MLDKPEDATVQTDEQVAAEILAGYENSTRGEKPPVEIEPIVEEEVADVPPPDEVVAEDPPAVILAAELKALKAKISASSGDADEIRKLHGAVGDINRTLKALQNPAKAEEAPADDELAAALKSAEAAAEEYPEVVGPLVKALKASIARQPAAQAKPEDIDERVTTAVSRIRETDAVEVLMEEHPDFETVRETPEYKAWLTSKPPEFQQKFLNTWNPAVVARGLTEFKDSLKKQVNKQNRLASAITPQGVPQKAGPSAISDEDALLRGYQSGPKRRIIKR
ncbi:MAG: hypothetical protein V4730_11750 [Pseudomonadota bacterium]